MIVDDDFLILGFFKGWVWKRIKDSFFDIIICFEVYLKIENI